MFLTGLLAGICVAILVGYKLGYKMAQEHYVCNDCRFYEDIYEVTPCTILADDADCDTCQYKDKCEVYDEK